MIQFKNLNQFKKKKKKFKNKKKKAYHHRLIEILLYATFNAYNNISLL